MAKLLINVNESFSHLPRAPIVEAVIDIRAYPEVALEEAGLKLQLKSRLGDYQFLDSLHEFEHQVNLRAGSPEAQTRLLGWKGSRFQSANKGHIVQFNRDGFVFSHLAPYISWEQLYQESMQLWSTYIELAQPTKIDRVGLRFVNRFHLPPGELRFEDYLQPAPEPPKGLDLPFHGFLHQDTLAVPEHPYAINVTRTIQPPEGSDNRGLALILDIDAFTTQGFGMDETLLAQRLLEMRWLKNKIFFGSVTSNALKLFQ